MLIDEKSFDFLSGLATRTMGIKMPPEKKQLLETRLHKRIVELKLNSFTEYCDYLKSNDNTAKIELENFFNSVSTNKTDFFRESSHFDYLRNVVLPEFSKKAQHGELKIWSCASSSGEELYSIAIEIEEYAANNNCTINYSILGTDISTKVLNIAKQGTYKLSVIEPVPLKIRSKYFTENKENNTLMTVSNKLKNRIKLGIFNLMTKNYNVPGPFDVIFCRNVLIYFDRDKQNYILSNLIGKLVYNGYLFLGHSESMAGMNLNLRTCAPAVFKKI